MIKTLSWQPFAAANMTIEQTRERLLWAMKQYETVCGLKIVSAQKGQRANIQVTGKATNEYAGYAKGSNIWISTIRNMSARKNFILGGIIIHEIGHTIGLKHTPETDLYRDYIMHPWGPSDDWWAPNEIKSLQLIQGSPSQRFLIHEIVYLGDLLRENRDTLDKLLSERNSLWEDYHKLGGAFILDMINKKIVEIRKVQNNSKTVRAQRAQKILLWKNKAVPKSIVPLVKTEQNFESNLNVADIPSECICGCGIEKFENEYNYIDESSQEPV